MMNKKIYAILALALILLAGCAELNPPNASVSPTINATVNVTIMPSLAPTVPVELLEDNLDLSLRELELVG